MCISICAHHGGQSFTEICILSLLLNYIISYDICFKQSSKSSMLKQMASGICDFSSKIL